MSQVAFLLGCFMLAACVLQGCGGGGRSSPPPTPSVAAKFVVDDPSQSPFPNNRFTVADPEQNTGLTINLPKPDCNTHPSDCQDIDVLNALDGFNVQPRLSVSFDGAIDPNSANSNTMFLIGLGDVLPGGVAPGARVGINQVVWNPGNNTLYAESDQLLDQHSRYLLVVTSGLKDTNGQAVRASAGFTQFRDPNFVPADARVRDYHTELTNALASNTVSGIPASSMVAAAIFTTQSVTSDLEKIRDQIKASTPAPADFRLGFAGERTVFALSQISSITFNRQISTGPGFSQSELPLSFLDTFPGTVGEIAFGRFNSPNYELMPEGFVPLVKTRTCIPLVQNNSEVFFTLFLPATQKPPSGWPVAIYGHGGGGNKNLDALRVASGMAAHGVATIVINAVGHGGGPLGTLVVTTLGSSVTLSAGGRGIDQNGDGNIDSDEGITAVPPYALVLNRDGKRQTVVDFMQLVRVIELGMDVDGDGMPDLDANRIYYFGLSQGGRLALIMLAIEPSLRAGVPNVFGGHSVDDGRLGPFQRDSFGYFLNARTPSLLNGGPPTPDVAFPFNENLPLRNQPALIDTVPGALEIQEYLDHARWAQESGDGVAYAPHLRAAPLPGVPPKPVIMQFAKGDKVDPNPDTTDTLRAGNLTDRTSYFRNDLAFASNPAFPKDPHGFLQRVDPSAFDAGVVSVAKQAQDQIGTFFASAGQTTIDPDGAGTFFEVPIVGPLPEVLNLIP